MRHNLRLWLICLVCLTGAPAIADGVHRAAVTAVVDGDTLLIDPAFEDGNEIRLVGIQAPKLPLGRKNFKKWPLADEAKAALEALTAGREVNLSFGGVRRDRYGRWLAHLHVADGTANGLWIQGELLRRGLARVYSFPDNRALVDEMLTLEREARARRQGIWAHPYYRILNTDPGLLQPLLGTFQLIEGRVLDAARVKGTTYLNFGADWRDDFTVAIEKRALGAFLESGIEPGDYEGQSIRVRGWLIERNGPMIRATHPEQIEVLRP